MISHPVSASNLDRWLQLLLLILVSNAITGPGTETPPVLAPGFWAAGLLGSVYSELHSRLNENHFDCGSYEYLSGGLCCKLCSPGEFVQKSCTVPHTQGKCEKCHPGTFTEAGNGLDSCRLCSSCDKNQEMVADCSATSDRKCQCRMGHFYADPQSPELCRPCSKCPQGIPVLQECSSRANTVCSSAGTNQGNRLFLLLPTLAAIAVFCY